jgi:hypothetical protein
MECIWCTAAAHNNATANSFSTAAAGTRGFDTRCCRAAGRLLLLHIAGLQWHPVLQLHQLSWICCLTWLLLLLLLTLTLTLTRLLLL